MTDTHAENFASRVEGLDGSAPSATPINVNGAAHSHAEDPFAAHRTEDDNPFAERSDSVPGLGSSPTQSGFSPKRDRRESKEWDASKVPPSRFQKREGSIYATPSSRDGQVGKNSSLAFTEKLKEKGWL